MSALKITYRSSTFAGKVVELDLPVVTLGRDPYHCDVLFDEVGDRVVSRKHAQLRWEDHTLVMVPMPGKVVLRGGVAVVSPVTVFSGDIFELAGRGGPAVEVSFDYVIPSPPLRTLQAPQFNAVAQTRLSPEAAEATTNKQVVRLPMRSVEQSADVTAPAAHLVASSPETTADEPPSSPIEPRTVTVEREPPPAAGASTTYLPVLPKKPAPVVSANRRTQVVLVAGATAIALAGIVFFAWFVYSKLESQRRASERVERLKEVFKDIPAAHGVLDDRGVPSPSTPDPTQPATSTPAGGNVGDVSASPVIEDTKESTSNARSTTRTKARQVFAEWKQLELERLSLGRGKSRDVVAQREQVDAKRRQLRSAYDALVASLNADAPLDAPTQAIHTAARHLGECDAVLPASLVERTLRFTQNMSASERSAFEGALSRAENHRYTPTITAALGDQGLPLELFFVPHLASGFDELKIGKATPAGLPKGMWQLMPTVAEKYGLTLGPDLDQASYDSADDRHRYEKETKAAAKLARDLYAGPAAGSALLVLTFWSNGDAGPLLDAKKNARLAPTDEAPLRVSLVRLWEQGKLGPREADAVEALATVAMASNSRAFGLGAARPFVHVEPEERR